MQAIQELTLFFASAEHSWEMMVCFGGLISAGVLYLIGDVFGGINL